MTEAEYVAAEAIAKACHEYHAATQQAAGTFTSSIAVSASLESLGVTLSVDELYVIHWPRNSLPGAARRLPPQVLRNGTAVRSSTPRELPKHGKNSLQ